MTIQNCSPFERYQLDLEKDGFNYDPAQENAVEYLQLLYERLIDDVAESSKPKGLRGLFRRQKKQIPIKGLYFWGGVGRGKTYLMDNFYESLPFDRKMRVHFHRFMRRVHHDLKNLPILPDPLEMVADRIAEETRVICFDEFFVSDITDAMILGSLLRMLFFRGVTLVATSNIEPSGLYPNGLQRQRFLPAIALLEKHTNIVNVDGGVDYRLRALERAELYHSPLDDQAESALLSAFESLVPAVGEVHKEEVVEIENRNLLTRYVGEDVVWFDFDVLCDGPRSQNDYIEIAREFHAVLLGSVPQMGREKDDQARRFVNMVDEFYDRNVKLVLSAEVPLENLYSDGRLSFEFQRTISRLLEMQSHEYLARPHMP